MKAVAAMRNQFGGHAVRTAAPQGGDAGAPAPSSRSGAEAGAGSARAGES